VPPIGNKISTLMKAMIPLDERMSPNLLRGRGKSIGGDLDVHNKGSEQNVEPLQSLHHSSIGYQSMHRRIELTKKSNPSKRNREHKQE
jgi:hypothetical protein